MKLMSNCTSQI